MTSGSPYFRNLHFSTGLWKYLLFFDLKMGAGVHACTGQKLHLHLLIQSRNRVQLEDPGPKFALPHDMWVLGVPLCPVFGMLSCALTNLSEQRTRTSRPCTLVTSSGLEVFNHHAVPP